MRSPSAPNDDLVSDDPFYTVVGDNIQGSYLPAGSTGSTSGGSTSGSVLSVTSGGIVINLVLDAAAQAAPVSFKNGLQQAVAILAANITDKITVNINIDYSGTGGGAAAGPDNGYYENYSWVRSELVNNASIGDTTFNSLPTGSTIQGYSNVAVWNAQLKLWGVIGANDTTTDDASAYFATDINPNLLVGVALHELTHAMGRVPYGASPDVFDFYRFTSPGVRLFSGAQTAPAAYFSLDGGSTKLADYGQSSDPSDFLNSGVQGSNDPFNEYYTSSTLQGLTAIDLKQLDALGFHVVANTPKVIEAVGSTSLVQIGSNYYMDPVGGGSGVELKYLGVPVAAGQFNPYTPVAAEQISTGYEVALKDAAGDQFSIWNTDANGNFVSFALYGATSAALETLETSFHQDLNGDGITGIVTTVIESSGSTSLVQVADNYFLNSIGGGSGPSLKYHGTAVTAGQFDPYVPVAAEQISTGYEVALKDAADNQFSIWNTDANGNFVSFALYGGASSALETLETSFHQDLNGDGTIGLHLTPVETNGQTSLIKSDANYYLDPTAGGVGPTLKYQGADVTVGQFNPYVPVAAEQISTGYEVALKDAADNQFSIWNTDANGNFVSFALYGATSASLETLETSFHQDLNGDGITGIVTTVIESSGSTSLVQVADNYFLNSIAGGSGPSLKYHGTDVTAGQFDPYVPVAAEQTSTGYEVALKDAADHLFSIWNTDANGNFASFAVYGAMSSALETLETSFHQDLNGDGTIGVPAQPAVPASGQTQVSGQTTLLETDTHYQLNPAAGGVGPTLKYQGADVTAGQFDPYVPIAAAQTSTGYEVALKDAASNQFSIWNTDANGNFTSYAVYAATSSALETLETSFHQDLNGDGTIGVPANIAQLHGSSWIV